MTDRAALVLIGEMLQTGGMSDAAFIVGQVKALRAQVAHLQDRVLGLKSHAKQLGDPYGGSGI